MKHKKENEKKLSLREAYPSLAKEWHPEKDDILTPDDVTPTDDIHVWWRCDQKHEWIATVKDRVNGAGCPHCPGVSKKYARKVTLASAEPEAVKFWHPTKNRGRTPDQFAQKSAIKVWWQCKCGHDWYAAVISMRFNPHCPTCHPGLGASHNYNLAVINPGLAAQWHPDKNGTLLPSHLTPFSAKKVWWKCSKGHEWIEQIAARQKGRVCPYCSGRKSDKNQEKHE